MKRLRPLIDGVFNFMEIWKDVKGYEDLYSVSSLGSVLGKKRGKTLKPKTDRYGYFCVVLCKENKIAYRTVHSIVAESFLNHDRLIKGLVVNHINHIRNDNRLENLEIVTIRENVIKTKHKYTSEYPGVCWSKKLNKWRAYISFNSKWKHLGVFDSELEACNTYRKALQAHSNIIFVEQMQQ